MSMKELTDGIALINVAAVVIETEEDSPQQYLLKTADQAQLRAVLSSGQEVELRKLDTLLAAVKRPDLVKGYDLTLRDLVLNYEQHALFQGGTYTAGSGSTGAKYADPVVGTPVTHKKFKVKVYMENPDTDGDITGYTLFTLTGCEGTPCEFDLQDNQFFSPSYTIQSRPKRGVSPLAIEQASALPTASAGE